MKSGKKVLLFVCDDLIGTEILNILIPDMIAKGLKPVIVDTGSSRNVRFKNSPPEDVSFYGVGLFRDIVVPFLEERSPQGIWYGERKLYHTYRQLSEIFKLPYHHIKDVNSNEIPSIIEYENDVVGGISVRFLQIFGSNTINLMKSKGFLWNIHGGILPHYKGLLIPVWVKATGGHETGCTLHHIDEGIDTGAVLNVETVPMVEGRSILKLYSDLAPKCANLISAELAYYLAYGRSKKGEPQDDPTKTYYPYPNREQIEATGLVFTTANEVVAHYLDRFTLPFSSERSELQSLLQTAITKKMEPQSVPVLQGYDNDKIS